MADEQVPVPSSNEDGGEPNPNVTRTETEFTTFEQMAFKIEELLGAFVPDGDKVVFLDVDGSKHETPILLGAAKQFWLAKWLKQNWAFATGWVKEHGEKHTIAMMVSMIDTEAAYDTLMEAFLKIHGDRHAIPENAKEPSSAYAGERYPLQEMVKALVPFFAHPLSELAAMTLEATVGSRLPR